MTEKATMGVLLQMVQQNDDKHQAGHHRLRDDWRDLEKRVMALERAYTDIQLAFTRVDSAMKAPVDAMRLTLSVKQVAGLVLFCCALIGSLWAMNYRISTRMDTQDYQLQDLKQQQQMVRTKVEGLERSVATLMGRTDKESK